MHGLNFNEIRPTFSRDVDIHKITDDEYVIHQTKLNYQIRINSFAFQLISLIDGEKSIEAIKDEMSIITKEEVDAHYVYRLLYENLFNYGLIDNNPDAKSRQSSNYLSLRFTLLPMRLVKALSSVFDFLFPNIKTFKWFLWCCLYF